MAYTFLRNGTPWERLMRMKAWFPGSQKMVQNNVRVQCQRSTMGIRIMNNADFMYRERTKKEQSRALKIAQRLGGTSSKNLYDILVNRKGVSNKVANDTVALLKRSGVQNDRDIAMSIADSKWRSYHWSPQKTRHHLRQKSFDCNDIENALRAVYGEEGISGGLQDKFTIKIVDNKIVAKENEENLSSETTFNNINVLYNDDEFAFDEKKVAELAAICVKRYLKKSIEAEGNELKYEEYIIKQKRRRKIAAFLSYRGYRGNVIQKVIQKAEEHIP